MSKLGITFTVLGLFLEVDLWIGFGVELLLISSTEKTVLPGSASLEVFFFLMFFWPSSWLEVAFLVFFCSFVFFFSSNDFFLASAFLVLAWAASSDFFFNASFFILLSSATFFLNSSSFFLASAMSLILSSSSFFAFWKVQKPNIFSKILILGTSDNIYGL